MGLNPSIREIANVAANLMLGSRTLGEKSKPDTLNLAADGQ